MNPLEAEAPVFDEPWQAQAFAMVVHLHERGAFTWPEWAATLSAEIARGDPAAGYYTHWLAALERLTTERGLATAGALTELKGRWKHAYEHTPHGRPVTLAR